MCFCFESALLSQLKAEQRVLPKVSLEKYRMQMIYFVQRRDSLTKSFHLSFFEDIKMAKSHNI